MKNMNILILVHCDIDSVMLLYYLSKCDLGHYNIVFKNFSECELFKKVYLGHLPLKNYHLNYQEVYSFDYNDYTIKCASCKYNIKTGHLLSQYDMSQLSEKNIYLTPDVFSKMNPEFEKYIFFDMFNNISGFHLMYHKKNYNDYIQLLYKNTREVFDLLHPADYINRKQNDELIYECNMFLSYYNIELTLKNTHYFYKWRHMIHLLFPKMTKLYIYDEIYSIIYTNSFENIYKEFNRFYMDCIIYKTQFMEIMYPYKKIYYGHILECKIKNEQPSDEVIIKNLLLD